MTNHEFEKLAKQFYCETGMMAPGKDVPKGMYPHNPRERHDLWCQWLERRKEA
jgi:hypothetical protein